jgi:hypothetical protein
VYVEVVDADKINCLRDALVSSLTLFSNFDSLAGAFFVGDAPTRAATATRTAGTAAATATAKTIRGEQKHMLYLCILCC